MMRKEHDIRVVGVQGSFSSDDQLPCRRDPVLADASGRLVRAIAVEGGWKVLEVSSLPIPDDVWGKTGTRVGPWPARGGETVVVLGEHEVASAEWWCVRASRGELGSAATLAPLFSFMAGYVSAQESGLNVEVHCPGSDGRTYSTRASRVVGRVGRRVGRQVVWYCHTSEASALWQFLAEEWRGELVGAAFRLARVAQSVDDFWAAAGGLRLGGYAHWDGYMAAVEYPAAVWARPSDLPRSRSGVARAAARLRDVAELAAIELLEHTRDGKHASPPELIAELAAIAGKPVPDGKESIDSYRGRLGGAICAKGRGSGADIDGDHRYWLRREWGVGAGTVCWVMLNPSTAGPLTDDPTVRRCMHFARIWGYSSLEIVNLFALRTTDPKRLADRLDSVGPRNDAAILAAVEKADLIVCAWGAHGVLRGRDAEVVRLLGSHTLHALRLTANGSPGHPLYIAGATKPFVWIDFAGGIIDPALLVRAAAAGIDMASEGSRS